MCSTTPLAIYLCFAFPVAVTAPQGMPGTFDHYQPGKLNQAAIERLREGDEGTARILLERAALLAPHEPSIAGNLAELRSYREAPVPIMLRRQAERQTASEGVAKAAPVDTVSAPGAANPAPLPALWPPK